MKIWLTCLAAGGGALLLQTTILSSLPSKPDLVLVLVVYLALSPVTFAGAIIAFLMGCLMDVFAGSTPGFFALTKTAVFFVVYTTRGRLNFESLPARTGLVFMAALMESAMTLALVRFTSGQPVFISSLGWMIIGSVLSTTLAAPLCFTALTRIGLALS
ncbi:MAG: rod shape-determining protein MreD [Deltaproteobacteria bacterium]|nr:rod shape-determining protein MreD [Deltaproteobacteria bacterium]